MTGTDRRLWSARPWLVVVAAWVLGAASGARAAAPASAPSAPAGASSPSSTLGLPPASAPPPAQPAPGTPAMASPVPPTARADLGADPGAGATTELATPVPEPAEPRVVPTKDEKAAPSDHDAVVGGWGVEVRPVAARLPVFARRAATGCPSSTVTETGVMVLDCPSVSVSTLGVRHWMGRNLGIDLGAALALGGGSDGGRLLDSYFGLGPAVGLAVLLANWRHLAVMASPNLTVVFFKAAGSADSTYVADLRADLEGELHFGFVGVPALSLGMRSGMLFRLEHAADVTLWSAGVSGATTVRSLLADLHLRYYF